MNSGKLKTIVYALALATTSGCSVMGELARDILTTPETKQQIAKNDFEEVKASIESSALQGKISWVQAMMKLRETDRYFASRYRSGWKYDSDEEEYYAYSLQLAERMDRKQISYAQFDAARIQRYNQIRARRQQLDEQQKQTEIQRENQKIFQDRQRQEQLNRDRALSCTSSAIGGQIYTNCY